MVKSLGVFTHMRLKQFESMHKKLVRFLGIWMGRNENIDTIGKTVTGKFERRYFFSACEIVFDNEQIHIFTNAAYFFV